MKTLREMIDIVEGKISESVDVGGISHSIVPHPGGRHQVVVKHGDKVMHTTLHNSEEDAKQALASQVAHSKKMLKVDEGMAEYDRRRKLQSQISKIQSIDFYITDDDGLIIAGPFEGRSDATEAFEHLVRQRQDINIIQGRALIVKLAGMRESVAEDDSGDYDYPYNMSARDKGRYDAMTGREYNNPYSAFGTQENNNNAIEYSAAYDNAKEQDVTEEATPEAVEKIDKLFQDKQ